MSVFLKKRELVEQILRRLSEVPGIGTQIYGEDKIADLVVSSFHFIFDELWWPEYMTWITSGLDGTYGSPTADISTITRWVDVKNVYTARSDTPLPVVPEENFNPLLLTGTQALFIAPDSTVTNKVFRCFPITATDTIYIRALTLPVTFLPETVLKLDSELIINLACFQQLEDDADNPGAASKFQTLFDKRMSQYRSKLNSRPISLDPNYQANIPTDWNWA